MYLLICTERNTGKINQVLLRLMNEKWVNEHATNGERGGLLQNQNSAPVVVKQNITLVI